MQACRQLAESWLDTDTAACNRSGQLRPTLQTNSVSNERSSVNNNTAKPYLHNNTVTTVSGVARLWSHGGHGSRGGGPGAKPPEAWYMQTISSCQMLLYAGLLPNPSSISPHLPPKKNCLDLRESHDPTRPGQGGHVPTCAHPWLHY